MTFEEYLRKMQQEGQQQIDAQHAIRKKSDEEAKGQISAAIDKAAQGAVGQYEDRIAAEPAKTQKLYDEHAITEAFQRRQIENTMADMGMTNSGLNEANQTAIALARGKADNRAREVQAENIRRAEAAIDQILADAESRKAQQSVALDKATNNWYTGAMGNLESASRDAAGRAYAADQKRLADQYAAEQNRLAREAEATAEKEAKIEAEKLKSDADARKEANKARADAIKAGKADGKSETRATYEAIYQYKTGDEKADAEAARYVEARQAAVEAGYTDEYADVIAAAAVQGIEADEAVEKMASYEVENSGVKSGDITKFYSGYAMDWITPQTMDQGTARNTWTTKEQWKPGLEKMIRKATENLEAAEMSEYAKAYALGRAVGELTADAVGPNSLEAAQKAIEEALGADTIAYNAAMEAWENSGKISFGKE